MKYKKVKEIPKISKRTFWDVDISKIDFEDAYESVITRVFDRGTLDEVYDIINYYGYKFVKKTIRTTDINLPNRSILLARAIFNLNYNDFKCSKRKPFRLYY